MISDSGKLFFLCLLENFKKKKKNVTFSSLSIHVPYIAKSKVNKGIKIPLKYHYELRILAVLVMYGWFFFLIFIYLFIYLFIFLPKISFTDTEEGQQRKEGNLPLPTTPTCWWKLRNLVCGLNLICLPPIFSCSACNCQTVIMLIAFFVVAVFELTLIFILQSGLRRNWSSMKYHDSITNTATNLANRSPLFF